MITAQRTGAQAAGQRTDTQLIPVPGLRPMPGRLDPRARGVLELLGAAVRALVTFAALMAAVVVLVAFMVVGALVLPTSVVVVGIVALVVLYVRIRAGR